MESPTQLQTHTNTWPPEQGWLLFWVWMAGAIAAGAASLTITSNYTPPISDWKAQLIAILPFIVQRIWQVFLLFRGSLLRFILWSALPFALCLAGAYVEPFWLALIVISAALLINVRQRAWIWLMAGAPVLLL